MEWWMYLPIFASAAAVIGALVITFKMGKWVGAVESSVQETFNKLENKMDQAIQDFRQELRLAVADFRQEVRVEIRQAVVDLRQEVRVEIRQAVVDLRQEVREAIKDLRKEFHAAHKTSSGSPIHLTDLGKAMSETLGGKDWANEIAQHLFGQAEGKEPYEIQDISYHYVHKQLEPNEEERRKIGKCAYEHGVKREQVLNVLVVELQDILLDKSGNAP